jgi:hypothetical protein
MSEHVTLGRGPGIGLLDMRQEVVPGAHADVTGVTSKGLLGHGQTGTLVITYPGRTRPKTITLKSKSMVEKAYRFIAEFNARAGTSCAH